MVNNLKLKSVTFRSGGSGLRFFGCDAGADGILSTATELGYRPVGGADETARTAFDARHDMGALGIRDIIGLDRL